MDAEKSELFAIYKSVDDKNRIILDNTLKMLSNRIYIDESGKKHSLLNYPTQDKNIEILDDGVRIISAKNGEKYALKIFYTKITSTGKSSEIYIFFKDYSKYNKIVVASSYSKKITDYVAKYDSQIFPEFSLLINLIDHELMPKFEPLSPNEMELVKKEYGITEYTTKKILQKDPIVAYYNLKLSDYIRIIRPSPTSGESVDYRVVVGEL